MAFRTKLDFSSNRQVKQHIETITVLSGGTSFGVPFSSLPTGPNLATSGVTSSLSYVLSTFSGNSATTVYTWYDSNMNTAINTLSAITPTISGITQNALGFTGLSFTTIDGNTVATAYSGVSFDLTPVSIYDLGGGNYSGSVQTDILDYLSASTLDFTGRTIWNDVSGITRTERLIITDSPQVGYVLGCIDSEGMSGWVPASSGGTGTIFTGGTVSGATNFTNGLTANTISATTYLNLPSSSASPITVVNTSNLFSTGLPGTGLNASGVTLSIFLGPSAGYGALSADSSNFIGWNAGGNATNANNSNFMGLQAGFDATIARYSNFFGTNTGFQATGANNSNFFSSNAGYGATNARYSNFFGVNAGSGATDAIQSNFLGSAAGLNATGASYSNFIGNSAGQGATGAIGSNFFGLNAGVAGYSASYANFIGWNAGNNATSATESNFIGASAGYQATNAPNSNFFGSQAGYQATGATRSNFMGLYAGMNAINASYSNLFGFNVGNSTNSIGSNNIIIGTNITLPFNTTNSINLGGVLFGTGTYSAITGNPSITGQTDGRIGVNIISPTESLDVSGNARIRTIGSAASSGALYYTATGVLTTNTSDGRLKHNIQTLTNALDKIKQLRGVSYDWIDGDGPTRIGFIAQEVESVVPELTFINNNSPEKYMGVHYENTVALLVEAIKELSSGVTISNNTHLETQTILAEDNNIDLNYSGTPTTALGGGITVLHAMGVDNGAELITDVNGNWITNNDFIPNKITIPNYTPSGSTDINGNLGNVTRDEDYLYIKSSTGWKRTNLESF